MIIYTASEASKKLDIPPRTLRGYCVNFSEFISDYASKRKDAYKREFIQNDLAILATIRELSQSGINRTQIKYRLTRLNTNDDTSQLIVKKEKAAIDPKTNFLRNLVNRISAIEDKVSLIQAEQEKQHKRLLEIERQLEIIVDYENVPLPEIFEQ